MIAALFAKIAGGVAGIWGKVAIGGAILAALVIALTVFASSQREAGRDDIRAKEAERVEDAREKWDDHANERPDFDSSIGRLRERSRD